MTLTQRSHADSVNVAISNEIVRIYKEQFGRGPTRTKTYWCGEDMITVVLEDTFTPVERTLARLGEHGRLRETRTFFQYASVGEFCEPIERLTGRTVRAFISGIDTVADGLSVETYILYPVGQEGTPRRDVGAPQP